jgi:hypothetical protein
MTAARRYQNMSPIVFMIVGYAIVALGACAAVYGGYLAKMGHDQRAAASRPIVSGTDANGDAPPGPSVTSPGPASDVPPSAPKSTPLEIVAKRVSVYNPSGDQQRALLSEIFLLKDRLPQKMWITRPRDVGAQSIARQYERVFERAGIRVEQEQQQPAGPDEVGIMIAVADVTKPPNVAVELAEAMRKLGFEIKIVPLTGDAKGKTDFSLYIGMEPL